MTAASNRQQRDLGTAARSDLKVDEFRHQVECGLGIQVTVENVESVSTVLDGNVCINRPLPAVMHMKQAGGHFIPVERSAVIVKCRPHVTTSVML